jgi:hypothetical protein
MGHSNHQSQGNQSATSLVNYVWRQDYKSVKKNYMDTKKIITVIPNLTAF